jgi:hypothetical protein
MERIYLKNYGIKETAVALIVFAKLNELGRPDLNPVAYDAEGKVAESGAAAALLLMQDVDYQDDQNLPKYEFSLPVMVIQHRVGNNTQIKIVTRGIPGAIPISTGFSHIQSDNFFLNLKSIVSATDCHQRKPLIASLAAHLTEDYYTQLMDEYAAWGLLLTLPFPSKHEIIAKVENLKNQIPMAWRDETRTVEGWYRNMVNSFASQQ